MARPIAILHVYWEPRNHGNDNNERNIMNVMKRSVVSLTVIGLICLTFGCCDGTEIGLGSELEELEKLIARDPEVMLFAVEDERDGLTRAYTIPKEKLAQLQSLHLGVDEDSEKVDLRRIVKNCADYIRQERLTSSETNDYKFVSVEIMSRKAGTNDVYYAKVEFSKQSSDWAVVAARGFPVVIAYALLDGEVLKPRVTE